MARYVNEIVLNKPDDFVHYIMNDYITKCGFKPKTKKGEQILQDGSGFLTAPRFLKYSYFNGVLHIEAWLNSGFGGEMNLEGTYVFAIKKAYKDELNEIINLLCQPLPQVNPSGGYNMPVTVYTFDTSKKALPGLLLGIFGTVAAFLLPLIGLLLSGFGFVYSKKATHSTKHSMANVGMVFSVLGIVLSIVMWIIYAIAATSSI